jgi:hypothetical protein
MAVLDKGKEVFTFVTGITNTEPSHQQILLKKRRLAFLV